VGAAGSRVVGVLPLLFLISQNQRNSPQPSLSEIVIQVISLCWVERLSLCELSKSIP
jgi:hypothetical protein